MTKPKKAKAIKSAEVEPVHVSAANAEDLRKCLQFQRLSTIINVTPTVFVSEVMEVINALSGQNLPIVPKMCIESVIEGVQPEGADPSRSVVAVNVVVPIKDADGLPVTTFEVTMVLRTDGTLCLNESGRDYVEYKWHNPHLEYLKAVKQVAEAAALLRGTYANTARACEASAVSLHMLPALADPTAAIDELVTLADKVGKRLQKKVLKHMVDVLGYDFEVMVNGMTLGHGSRKVAYLVAAGANENVVSAFPVDGKVPPAMSAFVSFYAPALEATEDLDGNSLMISGNCKAVRKAAASMRKPNE